MINFYFKLKYNLKYRNVSDEIFIGKSKQIKSNKQKIYIYIRVD